MFFMLKVDCHFGLQRPLYNGLSELLALPVFANQVFRFLTVCQ